MSLARVFASRGRRGALFATSSSSRRRQTPSLLSPSVAVGERSQSRPRSRIYDFEPVPGLDRRLYDPVPALQRPARRFSGRPALVVASPPARSPSRASKGVPARLFSPGGLLFAQPSNVVVCVQRSARREVLFAAGHAGRRHVNRVPGRRSAYSSISCSR